jgi:hypothetical protein
MPLLAEKNWLIPITVENFFADGKIDPAVRSAGKKMYGLRDFKYSWFHTTRYMDIFHRVRPRSTTTQHLAKR